MLKQSLEDILLEIVKLSINGDFHLEALYGEWHASCCLKQDRTAWVGWSQGKTPRSASAKILKILKKGKKKYDA